MRIIFAGTPEVAVPTLREIVGEHDVVGVITREDAPLGRKRVLTPSPVAICAEELGLPVYKTNSLDADATDWARNLHPDLGIIVAYGGLVRKDLLDVPQYGWVNLHFSALPKWRGAAPVQRALMAGETEIGYAVFQLVAELDAGAVFASATHDFALGTPASVVLDTLAGLGAKQVLRVASGIADGTAESVPQSGDASYAHKLTREDGRLDFTQSAERVLARWAGVTPEPGAWAELDEQIIKISELSVADSETKLNPGEVELIGKTAYIGTGTDVLRLDRVQPAGKPVMQATDWLRGRGGKAVIS